MVEIGGKVDMSRQPPPLNHDDIDISTTTIPIVSKLQEGDYVEYSDVFVRKFEVKFRKFRFVKNVVCVVVRK